MKLKAFLSAFLLFIYYSLPSTAQAPAGIPYQAVARDLSGNPIASQLVSVRFSIRNLTTAGTILYQESHSTTTSTLGLFNLTIGLGTPVTGTFSSIPWNTGAKFLQVELDPAGGSTYVDMGTQQLMSVPYALFAGNVPNGLLNNTMYWDGSAWVASALITNTGINAGVGTSSPDASAMLEVNSTTKGFLLPRMNSAQRDAIPTPAPGLIIFNTDNGCIELRALSNWMSYCDAVCTPQPNPVDAGLPNPPTPLVVAGGSITLAALTPIQGTGVWTILTGTGGSFSNSNDPQSNFTGVAGQTYNLKWTVSTSCASLSDTLIVQYSCPANFSDCNGIPGDGCEVNLMTNAANCGNCGNICVFPNAIAGCTAGICTIVSCLPGFVDLDGIAANGCEYACTPSGGTDLPDNSFVDSNCDGIDGTTSLAIFVSTTTGSDLNAGTKAAPKKTITNAISTAQSTGKTQVLVSQGTYNESVILINGISVYGGYSSASNWQRSGAFTTTISTSALVGNDVQGVRAFNLTSSTVFDRMTVVTGNNSLTAGSNYAVHCTNSGALTIRNCIITSGNAGNGSPGGAGTNGSAGNNGTPGTFGHCDANVTATGGAGGTSACIRTGGAGGNGGYGVANGSFGNNGTGGTPGGSGGSSGDPGVIGGFGIQGANGTAGANGPISNGSYNAFGLWTPSIGANGVNGIDGNGGGGGGGGGGQDSFFSLDGTGNGGGGGGAGGCKGTMGFGGTGGGGSFGILALNSSGITITSCTINRGSGGNGGNGGSGGTGGSGGNGGPGGTNCLTEVGRGGNGGNGGVGGAGGHGAGGQGGPSYGIVTIAGAATISGVTHIAAPASTGGTSSGNAGSNGASANTVAF